MGMSEELAHATDEQIDDAVEYADPMVLRGLLYQLTGDEAVAGTRVEKTVVGWAEPALVTDPDDLALLRSKAAEVLRICRDEGPGVFGAGDPARLRTSLSLSAGTEIPADEVDLWIEQLALEPWARAAHRRAEPAADALSDFTVLVIGAGSGGITAAAHLKRAGFPIVVIEKNPEVGGTWYENRYPGARVDTPSRMYTYTIGVEYDQPYPFCPQSFNEAYINWLADKYDVRADIVFNTEVSAATWDDEASLWRVEAVGPDGPYTVTANAVISAVGALSRPNTPVFDGADIYTGQTFHTARWPEDLDWRGKRIAIIGSGLTAYQLMPELAEGASALHMFQRNASWCFTTPNYVAPYPEQVTWLDRNFPLMRNFARFRTSWMVGPETLGPALESDPDYHDPRARSELNMRVRQSVIDFMNTRFADRPDLLEKMTPDLPPFTSRPARVDADYNVYDTLLLPHVDVVTDGIKGFTETGIETVGGEVYDVDIIIFATGFKANDMLWPMEIRGRDGVGMNELWSTDGARAYLTAMMPGFPNFFTLFGPNSNALGGLGVYEAEEMVIRFAVQACEHLVIERRSAVEVSTDAYERFNAVLDQREATKIYADSRVTNYYRNSYGRSAVNAPFDIRETWSWLRDPSGETPAWVGPKATPESEKIRPYFGEDLVVS